MVLVSCKTCGKEMNRKPSELKTKSGHSFCSLKCAGEYWADLRLQKKRASEKETKAIIPGRRKPGLLVDRGFRPINPMAKEAWDRRILAGEIRYF
jgi:hypothetical protein